MKKQTIIPIDRLTKISPIEKAKQLVDMFWKFGNLYPTTTYAHAKICAIQCVGEIVLELINAEVENDITGIDDGGHITAKLYWERVIEQINKL